MQLLEQLESRRLLASFTASTVAELISDINAANAAGGSNTITLKAGTTFKLDGPIDGTNGLPTVAAANDLTILGSGDTIQRSTAKGTLAFRLFAVAGGGSLSLNNLTLSRGLANVPAGANGGAISNEGTLSLNGVSVQNSIAQGQAGSRAAGGGIYSSGALTVSNSAIQNNQALGGDGVPFSSVPFSGSLPGGPGLGGGLYIAGGTVTLSNTTFSSNLARGGKGADAQKTVFATGGWASATDGGSGMGGAIYIAAGTVTLRGATITANAATGGVAGNNHKGALFTAVDGLGLGGGINIASGAVVSLDSFTVAHTNGNTASTGDNDIFGSFTILA